MAAVDYAKLVNKLQRFGADAQLQTKQEVQAAALEIQANMVRDAPVDTGNLRQLIVAEPTESDYSYKLWSKAWYSAFLEFGTRAHTIEVNNKRVLAASATEVFGKRVNHPGTAPRPFFYDNFNQGQGILVNRLKNMLRDLRSRNR